MLASSVVGSPVVITSLAKHSAPPPLSAAAQRLVVGGRYQHYKGDVYQVLNIARHSETLEELVVYVHNGLVWVRPVGMFCEDVLINGVVQPRFQLVQASARSALPAGCAIVAHRGAKGARENSLAAFGKAYEAGFKTIECDVRICGSGELVLAHDDDISRLSGASGLVSALPLAALRTLGYEEPATLFAAMPSDMTFVLDIKSDGVAQRLAYLIEKECVAGRNRDQFIATGFNHRELALLKQQVPEIKLVPAFAGVPAGGVDYLVQMGAQAVCLLCMDGVMDVKFAHECRQKGIALWLFVPMLDQKVQEQVANLVPEACIVDVA